MPATSAGRLSLTIARNQGWTFEKGQNLGNKNQKPVIKGLTGVNDYKGRKAMKAEIVEQAEWVGNVMNMTKSCVGFRMRGGSLRMKLNVASLPLILVPEELVVLVDHLPHLVLFVGPRQINYPALVVLINYPSQIVRVLYQMDLDMDLLYHEIIGEGLDINHEPKQYLLLETPDPLLSQTQIGEGIRGIARLEMEKLEIPSEPLEALELVG